VIRTTVRTASVMLILAAVTFGLAVPASAHTVVEMDKPYAGATDVRMTVTAEAESRSAGIASVRIVLPVGISADTVSLVDAPLGWALSRGPDGYTVSGNALPARASVRHVVRVARLPARDGVLTFKSYVTYSDGQVDQWVEERSGSNPDPAHPAPTVTIVTAGSRWWLRLAWLAGAVLALLVAAAATNVVLRGRRRRSATPRRPPGPSAPARPA
jgi:Domain of unkown function (DUF1775)